MTTNITPLMSPEQLERSIDVHTGIDESRLHELLNRAGNHEAKLLTAAILASEPDRWFSAYGLRTEVNSRQGDIPSWLPDHSVFYSYCRNNFEPIGIATLGYITGTSGKTVERYRGNPQASHEVLAMSGALMGWSLNYPEVSVQDVFGSTNSRSSKHSPQTRLQIIQELITAPDDPTMHEVAISLGMPEDTIYINGQLQAMRDNNIIDIDQKLVTYNPTISVIPLPSISKIKPVGETSKEIRALRETLTRLAGQSVTLEQLLTETAKTDDEIDLVKIRHRVNVALRGDGSLPELQKFEVLDTDGRRFTKVKIKNGLRAALTNLLETIDELSDVDRIDFHSQEALKIINNPAACAQLMQKARSASVQHLGAVEGSEGLERRVKETIAKGGSMTIRAIMEEIGEDRGRKISITSIHNIVGKLVDSGELSKLEQRTDLTKKRATNYYGLSSKID